MSQNDQINNQRWNFPASRIGMDRSVPRSLLERGGASDLTGVDGSVAGGLKPFPGFQIAHEFDVTGWGSNHNATSNLLEVFPINFVVGESGYGFGFVYRVQRKTYSGTADIFMDYWQSVTGVWTRSVVVKEGVALDRRTAREKWQASPSLYPDDGRIMSVVPWGRVIYVFVEGSEPLRIIVEEASPTAPVVQTNTGPGIQPILLSEDKNESGLGAIVSTGDADRPGKGQVFLTAFFPSETGLGLTQDDTNVRAIKSGDYAIAYLLQNSKTGLRSGLSEVAQIRSTDFDLDGSGSGAYVEEANLAIEICYDEEKFDRALIYRSVRTQAAGGTYIAGILHLEAVIELADYATDNNSSSPLSGNDFAQAIYFVERDDKQLVSQETFEDRVLFDENMPKAGVAFWYESTMLASTIRDTTVSSSVFGRTQDVLRNMGELRWSSLTDVSPELFPAENRYLPPLPNSRILAMRAAGPNVIGFGKDRQFLIRKEGSYLRALPMHEGYGLVSERALDSVGSIIYFVSPNGLKAVSMDGQLDDVGSLNEVFIGDWRGQEHAISLAYDTNLASLFIFNSTSRESYVLWFNTARVTRLEDMRFQQVVRGPWPSGFVWDSSLSSGGGYNKTYRGDLEERAFFVQNPVRNSNSDTPLSAKFRLWIVDERGIRTQKAGLHASARRRTLLDYTGSGCLRVQANFASGTAINLSSGAVSTYVDPDMAGCCLHVLKAQDKSLEGRRAWIRDSSVPSAVDLESATASQLHGLVIGDVVAVSPVVFRWVASPLWVPVPGNPQYGEDSHFRLKRADAIGVAFSEVVGLSDQIDLTPASYWTLTFNGDDASEANRSFPRSQETEDRYVSLVEGEPNMSGAPGTGSARYGWEATILTPGIEIRQPDVSFRVLSMQVLGAVLPSERSRRTGQ